MELLKTITQKDIGIENSENVEFKLRRAARAVIFKDDKVAIMYVGLDKYHKLPGGGVEESEDLITGLKREIKEETGCLIDGDEIKEIGKVIEYRNKYFKKQDSYCYITNVTEDTGELELTEKEKSKEFSLIWVELDEAIKLLKSDNPKGYTSKFIKIRDSLILKKAKEIIDGS